MRARPCFSHRWRCESWCVAFAKCESETMAIPLADVFRLRYACSVPARDRAVQGEKNRVRCERPRCHARVARPDRDDARAAWRWWCPLSARTRACEPREGFAADGRLRRRSSLDCDAGASRCPRAVAVWISASGDPGDVRSRRPIDPHDEIPLTRRDRSASRDPRRWLARIRRHVVRAGRVPSRARARQGGAPA